MKKYVLLIIAMLTIGHLSAQVKIDDFELCKYKVNSVRDLLPNVPF